jgi:hypothetical protein
MKSSLAVDVINPATPRGRIGQIVQADFLPESENEHLVLGSQRYSSSDLQGDSIARRSDARLSGQSRRVRSGT